MSTFNVSVRRVNVIPHSNADALELAEVFGYQSIIKKGQFQSGDLAIYIPESAVLPEALIKHIGLEGKLAGSNKDRVKAVKLRGTLSQGITISPEGLETIYGSPTPAFEEGEDWTEYLQITKYVPPIPMNMAGELERVDSPYFKSYTDIENIKRFPNVIQEGEDVYATEKLHGSCSIYSLIKIDGEYKFFVTSKGICQRNQCAIKESDGNVYWRAAKLYELEQKMRSYLIDSDLFLVPTEELTFFGEVLGVQDLKYGCTGGNVGFRLFDIRNNGKYMDYDSMMNVANGFDIPVVPVLYRGNSIAEALKHTDGTTLVLDGDGKEIKHIREGIVIAPTVERYDAELGRVILKSISGDYLTRKGDTTEME